MTGRAHSITARAVASTALSACALFAAASFTTGSASAAPSVSSAQTALDRAVARHDAAQGKLDAIRKRAASQTARLDKLADRQAQLRTRLDSYSRYLYRNGKLDALELLMQARDFNDFTSRWTMLARVSSENARLLVDLERANRAATASAKKVLAEQESAAAALAELEAAESRARADLSASKAALAEYRRRTAARAAAAAPATQPKRSANERASSSRQRGRGAWQTGVASHYSRTFTGRAADGSAIGPNSMMVAHKTLPFGTLVEFEYQGRTAVARVADRGPFTPGRDWDLGPGVVRVLDFSGVHEVRYRIIGR